MDKFIDIGRYPSRRLGCKAEPRLRDVALQHDRRGHHHPGNLLPVSQQIIDSGLGRVGTVSPHQHCQPAASSRQVTQQRPTKQAGRPGEQ